MTKTSRRHDLAPSSSSSIPYDKELWDLYVWSGGTVQEATDAEKRGILETILVVAHHNRTEAIEYLKYCKQAQDPNNIQIGFQCPRENIPLKIVEFDGIKVFYHPTWPDDVPHGGDTWNFYIGRSGAPASQCIDWAKEGIEVFACGLDGQWDVCPMLVVTPGTRVRITYPFGSMRRTREIIFPYRDPIVPSIYLESM